MVFMSLLQCILPEIIKINTALFIMHMFLLFYGILISPSLYILEHISNALYKISYIE